MSYIELEQSAVLMLKRLVLFSDNPNLDGVKDFSRDVKQWLLDNEYVTEYKKKFAVTESGLEFYETCKNKLSANPVDLFEFKNEALTGMDKHGNRSKIDSAVLSKKEFVNKPDFDHTVDAIAHFERTARQFGVTVEELQRRTIDGSFKLCKHCGEFSIFHSKGAGKLRSKCVSCRKT